MGEPAPLKRFTEAPFLSPDYDKMGYG